MSPAQQAAVQAVFTQYGGGTLTDAQVAAIGALVDARNDVAAAATLSFGLTTQGTVSTGVLLGWLADTGLLAKVSDAANNSASPYYATLRNSALAMLLVLQNSTPLDLSNSVVGQGNLAMLGAWVSAQAITSAQQSALEALAAQPVTIPWTAVNAALNAVT